jgi:hypothetical protein
MLKEEKMLDFVDTKVWQAAVLKGGGLGLFGGYLFGEYSIMGVPSSPKRRG